MLLLRMFRFAGLGSLKPLGSIHDHGLLYDPVSKSEGERLSTLALDIA